MGVKTFYKNVRQLFRAEKRSYSVSRLYEHLQSIGFRFGDDPDVAVTSATAMRISTVFTCVLVRAESMASIPFNVMQKTDMGREVASSHPAHYLIHDKPNPFQTASDFWKTVSAQMDLHGNSYGVITYNGRELPTRIDLIPCPSEVEIAVVEGSPYYRYKGEVYEDWQILHFKDLSLDGVYGCSRIKHNADTLGYASKLRAYGRKAIGSKPPGYFSTDAPYNVVKEQQDNINNAWKEKIAAGDTPTVPFGLKYNSLIINPGDAQYLDAVNATKEDIYGIFRVPPTLAQNYERATFANAEQQDLVFIKHTMLPRFTSVEQECNAKLYAVANRRSKAPFYTKANVNGFLRGDFLSRTQGYKTLWERGLISGNMVADLEDWNHFEGGDERFVPMNMIPLSKVDGFIDTLTKPVQSNAGNEGGADNSERSATQPFQGFIYNLKTKNLPLNEHGS